MLRAAKRKEVHMSIFKQSGGRLVAAANGRAIPLSEVPDEAFASGMLGTGFAVRPTDGAIFCPADGKLMSISEARHAYTIETTDGLELLLHIGIDTVSLGGRGFFPLAAAGDALAAGDPLARVELDVLHEAGLDPSVVVLISNSECISRPRVRPGAVRGGHDVAMTYEVNKKTAAGGAS